MKILILHQHFKTPETGGAIRSWYLATALAQKGITPVVITAHNGPGYRRETFDGIDVHYLPVSYDNRFGFARRIVSFLRFAFRAVRYAARFRDCDLCYAISTPLTTGLAARMIRRRYNIPYIFEVGDLWPDAPVEMGFVRLPVLARLLFRMERRIYARASAIVALSPAIRDVIARKVPGKHIELIPNMADTEFFSKEVKDPALEEKYGVRGKFVVSYIGAMGVANGLSYFLRCAEASAGAGLPVQFLLCGDGAMAASLVSDAKAMRLENLRIIPFQNRDGVRELMNVTDANFICYQPVKILETGSPNKYFDGLAAGKLTVINFGGWIRDEIAEECCGVSVNPHDADDFVVKLRPFLDDAKMLERYQASARALAEKKYSRILLTKKFSELVEGEASSAGMRSQDAQ